MAADMHIHIRTPEITEEVLNDFFANSLGHSRCDINFSRNSDNWSKACMIISETPDIHVGEVSWLKAALFDDEEAFVPQPVQSIAEAIGEMAVIDDELIAKIKQAFEHPNLTCYEVSSGDKVIKFLEEHKGKECFTVSW